jgi:hypothetical protein
LFFCSSFLSFTSVRLVSTAKRWLLLLWLVHAHGKKGEWGLVFTGEGEVREEIRFWLAEREDCWSMAGWRGKPRILKDQSRGFSGLAKRRRSREGE